MTILRQLAEEVWTLHGFNINEALAEAYEAFGQTILGEVGRRLHARAALESDDSPLRWAMYEAIHVVETLSLPKTSY